VNDAERLLWESNAQKFRQRTEKEAMWLQLIANRRKLHDEKMNRLRESVEQHRQFNLRVRAAKQHELMQRLGTSSNNVQNFSPSGAGGSSELPKTSLHWDRCGDQGGLTAEDIDRFFEVRLTAIANDKLNWIGRNRSDHGLQVLPRSPRQQTPRRSSPKGAWEDRGFRVAQQRLQRE
jgi:hypothetical protein